MKYIELASLFVIVACFSFCSGCAETSAAIDESAEGIDGSRFVMTEEPAGVMCVCDVRDVLPSDEPIAILGRIGGLENPWTEGEASFVMSDPSVISLAEDDHECGDNCPYCAKKQKEQMQSMAFVQFVDDAGHVIRTDARKLLGLSEDQMIIVYGKASLNRTGHIVVAANGLYIRE